MKKFPIMLVRATRQVLGCDNKFFGGKKVIFGLRDLCKGLFCGTRGEGLVSLVPTFASLVATKSPKWQKLFFRSKSVIFGLLDLWKGLVVALEVRGWCHSCHFLHHSGLFELTRRPSWCKKWHSWHHPLTSRATTRPFQRSRRPKITDFQRKKSFCHFGLFVATRDAKVGTRDTNPSPLVPQKRPLQRSWRPKITYFQRKNFLSYLRLVALL